MPAETLPPPPPPLAVHLRHEEVMGAALASRSRGQGGAAWLSLTLLVLLALAIWIGQLASFALVQRLPFSLMASYGSFLPIALPTLFALFAVAAALQIEQRRATRAYLSHLARVGSPLERGGTYTVTDTAFELATDRLVLAPRWDAIDTVERGEHGWVLSADQLHFLIPFAAFPNADAQRPLLAAITARLTPEARARSREAVDFAAVPPEVPPAAAVASPWARPAAAEPAPAPASEESAEADLPVAKGWLTQAEAGWAAGVIYQRVAKPGFHRWAYPLTGAVTGMLAALTVVGLVAVLLPLEPLLRYPVLTFIGGLLLPLAGGAWGLGYGHKRLAVVMDKAWRGGLAARGTPEQVEAVWRLTPTGLAFETGRFAGEASYESVHQVLHEQGYWIIATDGLTLCIPDAAFPSGEAAADFIASLRERIGEEARARSVTP